MQIDREESGAGRVATLDIETTAFDPADGEVVAIGVGVHESGRPAGAATYDCLARGDHRSEADLIRAGCNRLATFEADRLVTYNGAAFDLPFLADRMAAAGADPLEVPLAGDAHVDLFAERKRVADEHGEKWPSLEESLAAYGYTPAVTEWRGAPLTNGRFGEELGPAYLDAVAEEDDERAENLRAVVEHYLTTDLEGNHALYFGDCGADFEPAFDGHRAQF